MLVDMLIVDGSVTLPCVNRAEKQFQQLLSMVCEEYWRTGGGLLSMDLGSDPARLPKRSLRMLVGHLIVPFICACQGVRLCPLESPRALALQRRAVAVLHRWSGSKEIVRF